MTNNTAPIEIFNLYKRPAFFDVVADRIWRAWWQSKGKDIQDVKDGLRKSIEGKSHYNAYVATNNNAYLGSALVIESDVDERPKYTRTSLIFSPKVGFIKAINEATVSSNLPIATLKLLYLIEKTEAQIFEAGFIINNIAVDVG